MTSTLSRAPNLKLSRPFGRLFIAVLLCFLSACSSPAPVTPTESINKAGVAEKVVIAEGQAVIQRGATALAKQQALQDAIRQATMQSAVAVTSQTAVNQGLVQADAFSLRANAHVNQTQILKEWVEHDIYNVRAKVTLTESDSCVAQYRKRIVATGFPFAQPSQVNSSESSDIAGGIPREINNFLMESGQFIGFNATHISLYAQPKLAPELFDQDPYKSSQVIQMASSNGAQFILSGVIRDLQIEATDYIQGSGPSGMLKSLFSDVWSRRGIGIDVYVHDGFTGALIFQYRYTDTSAGDVWIPSDYTVGSERFKATQTGEKISRIITRAASDIGNSLSCYPFATRIIKLENSNVYIDAGAQDRLNVGDQLVVYSDASDELKLEGGRQWLEHDKQPAGMLTINEVKPRYAVGSFEASSKQTIRAGDWVKSW